MTTYKFPHKPTGARIQGPMKAKNKEWFFRRYAANGVNLGGPGETFKHRQHCLSQAVEMANAFGLRLFEPGYNTDMTENAEEWVEVKTPQTPEGPQDTRESNGG